MRAATVVQVLQDLFMFYCIFILLVIAPLKTPGWVTGQNWYTDSIPVLPVYQLYQPSMYNYNLYARAAHNIRENYGNSADSFVRNVICQSKPGGILRNCLMGVCAVKQVISPARYDWTDRRMTEY